MDWDALSAHIRQHDSRHRINIDGRFFKGLENARVGRDVITLATSFALYTDNGLSSDQFDFLLSLMKAEQGEIAAIGLSFGLSNTLFDGRRFLRHELDEFNIFPKSEDVQVLTLSNLWRFRHWKDVPNEKLLQFADALSIQLKSAHVDSVIAAQNFLSKADNLPEDTKSEVFALMTGALVKLISDNVSLGELDFDPISHYDIHPDSILKMVKDICVAAEGSEYESKIFVLRIVGSLLSKKVSSSDLILLAAKSLTIDALAECDDDDESTVLTVFEQMKSLSIVDLTNLRHSILSLRLKRSLSFNSRLMDIYRQNLLYPFDEGGVWASFGGVNLKQNTISFDMCILTDCFFDSVRSGESSWIPNFLKSMIDAVSLSTEKVHRSHLFCLMALMSVYLKKTEPNLDSILDHLFLQTCDSARRQTQNAVQLLNLLDAVISHDENAEIDYLQEVIKQKTEFLKPKHDYKRKFEELEALEATAFCPLVQSSTIGAEHSIVERLSRNVGDKLGVNFTALTTLILDEGPTPEAVVLLGRVAKKLNLKDVDPGLQVFMTDATAEDIDGLLAGARCQIMNRMTQWEAGFGNSKIRLCSILGYYLSLIEKKERDDPTHVSAKKIIEFSAGVFDHFIREFSNLAVEEVTRYNTFYNSDLTELEAFVKKLDKSDIHVSVSKYISVDDLANQLEKWGTYDKDKEVFQTTNTGLNQIIHVIKTFEGREDKSALARLIFQMFVNTLSTSIERLHKEKQLDIIEDKTKQQIARSACMLETSHIFLKLQTIPIERLISETEKTRITDEIVLCEFLKIIDAYEETKGVRESDILDTLSQILSRIESGGDTYVSLKSQLDIKKIFQFASNSKHSKDVPAFKIELVRELVDCVPDELKSAIEKKDLVDFFITALTSPFQRERDLLLNNLITENFLLEAILDEFLKLVLSDPSKYSKLRELVELANEIGEEKGHLKILASLEEFLDNPNSDAALCLLGYASQLGFHLGTKEYHHTPVKLPAQNIQLIQDSKLCTYTQTQREFQSQHWYHCHTCTMLDSVGVCSVCARVCHADHQLSYAKHSSFFCDCGAQDRVAGRRPCQALQKRITAKPSDEQTGQSHQSERADFRIICSTTRQSCIDTLVKLVPKLEEYCQTLSMSGTADGVLTECESSARNLLENFQKPVGTSTLFLAKADFQTNQGALENVKPTISPDGNNAIRKVLLENSVHRNFVGVLHDEKEKYLVILHEKNKVSLLALSYLLSRKSTSSSNAVSRQCSYTPPFTVMNILPSTNSGHIITSGLREAAILVISGGSFGTHTPIHLNVPADQFITRVRWIPQVQGLVVVATTSNLKIFNVGEDNMSPKYNFKVEEVIQDFTHFFAGRILHLLILTSTDDGPKLFVMKVTEDLAAATHGEVAVKEVVNLPEDLTITAPKFVTSGSVYFSFATGMLFLACQLGNRKPSSKKQKFWAMQTPRNIDGKWSTGLVTELPDLGSMVKDMLSTKRSFDKSAKDPTEHKSAISSNKYLRNLRDADGHPGMLTASFGHHTVVVTATEKVINLEILGDVRPILDSAATVHTFRGTDKPVTSILAVAEDGALRGWTVNPAHSVDAEYWKTMASNNVFKICSVTDTEQTYPVDFLERCEVVPDSDLEYSSSQLQRVYNRQRLRRCLEAGNNANSHFVSWKGNFSLSIKSSRTIRGFRIRFGDNYAASAPGSIELCTGRVVHIGEVTNARWFDVILTPDEALQANGKLTLHFTPGAESDRKIVVDALRVYRETRTMISLERKSNETQMAQKSCVFNGPSSENDYVRSAAVESFAAAASLMSKSAQRAQYLDKTWKYLNPQTATTTAIQNCGAFFSVDIDLQCDIFLTKSIPNNKTYDWKSLQTAIHQIYIVAENRPANFRGHFTTIPMLASLKLITKSFHDLIKSDLENFRPDILPHCTDYRNITRKLVYILSLVSLLDTAQMENITSLFEYENMEIVLGMKEAVLEALKYELPKSSSAEVVSDSNGQAEIICNENDDDDETVVDEETMDVDDDDEDYDEDAHDDEDEDDDDDEDDIDEDEEDDFANEILSGNGEGIVVHVPEEYGGIDLDRLLQENDQSIAELALALSIQDRDRRDPPMHQLPETAAPEDVQEEPEKPQEDPIFSKERQRQFSVKLISQIMEKPFSNEKLLIVRYQLIFAALSKLNPEESDEQELIDNAVASLLAHIKKSPTLLFLTILAELLSANRQISANILSQMTDLDIVEHLSNFVKSNIDSLECAKGNSDPKPSGISFPSKISTDDFKPFAVPAEYKECETVATMTTILRVLELCRDANSSFQIPSSLLDLIVKVIVRENAPRWFLSTAKKFGLAFTQSAEKFKARIDRELLMKNFDKIQLSMDNNHGRDIPYNKLSELYEELKVVVDISEKRPYSWQRFVDNRPNVIELILNLSSNVECCNKDVIKLIEVIITPLPEKIVKARKQSETESRRKRSKSQSSKAESITDKLLDKKKSSSLITHPMFMRKHLFSESESVRWAIHSLLKTIFTEASPDKKRVLVDYLWTLFNLSTRFGQRAIQFTDLLGYFTIKSSMAAESLKQYGDLVGKTLNSQLCQLSTHSNAILYSRLAEQLSFGGFYLESQLCMSCNSQNEDFVNSTITGMKGDTKYTTTSQIYKLKTGQEIQRVNLKLSDVKRTRHVKMLTLYYTTRTSIPIIELKNSPHVWLKAKTIELTSGQTEAVFNLPVPIKANFLIIDFLSFYDQSYAIPETLPCPRCSNNVQTDPGICGNCGENVFQCHKCRIINYDERDPYLCTQCGYCRYAKFSLSMSSRACTIADPVDTEDERKRAEVELKKQLEKADTTWLRLSDQRNDLENAVGTVDSALEEKKETKPKSSALVDKYNECKNSFNDITATIKAAIASREALADYERRSNLGCSNTGLFDDAPLSTTSTITNCYGCAINGAENNLILVRALCQVTSIREALISDGAVDKLLSSPSNLASSKLRKLIRRAICRLVRGSPEASKQLGDRLQDRILTLARQNQSISCLNMLVREDLELLKQSLKYRDTGWEIRIKAAMSIFISASDLCKEVTTGTSIVNGILLPCLAIIKKQTLVAGDVSRTSSPYDVNYQKWQSGDHEYQFDSRKSEQRTPTKNESDTESPIKTPEAYWLPRLMFCQWSQQARIQACAVMQNLASCRKTDIVELMVTYFSYVQDAGETAVEYLDLLHTLISSEKEMPPALSSHMLKVLGELLMSQINQLQLKENENAMMSSSATDLRIGKALDRTVQLLNLIVVKSKVPAFKMIKPILRGYLSLCRITLLRTKAIDDAQGGLLKLLESLTSGSEEEARDFVRICFKTLSHFSNDDFQTTQFVFERLCNIILPDSSEDDDFRVQIDKDPLQEEFLPGRMVNNPYPSTAVGVTIRDLKNKICRDTELIAMVEDDTSLELLVANKIVKLDLRVTDVYKKIWLQNHENNVPMRIIYRMRGLMGEATEEFVETLPEDDHNEEETFKRASYLAVDNGLEHVLEKMSLIKSLSSRSRPLLDAALKLLGFCVHLKVCRDNLAISSSSMLNILLQVLNISIEAKEATLVEDILSIMNRVLGEAASHGTESEAGHKHELTKLLKAIDSEFVQSRQNIVQSLMEMIPFLSFGDEQLMEQLINHFDSVLSNLANFDDTADDQHKIYLECFCDILKGLKPDNPGSKHLKDLMYARNLPRQAIEYLRKDIPSDKNYVSEEWKTLLERPVLPFILRILAGLATGHPECQKLIGEMCIPELHRLEQVAAGGIGTLAEEALEALRDNSDVFKRVSEARRATRKEKVKIGRDHRTKTLLTLGMAENTDGTIKAEDRKTGTICLNVEDGPLCVICKEGALFEPKKIMSIYAYCKRATVEPFETASRKTVGFETVSSFNLIHNECHKKAVQAKRSRDEWETSFLHNNSTKCNALLPVWGPDVSDSEFSSQMARFNEAVRDATGVSPDVTWLIHNIKLCLHRFSTNGKFYLDAGGGGPESNMKYLPHLIHYILYTINTMKTQASLKAPVHEFLNDFNILSAWTVQGVFFLATSVLIVYSKAEWAECRVNMLKNMLICSHMREVSINPKKDLAKEEQKPFAFEKYKPTILFWWIIDQIFEKLFDHQQVQESNGSVYTEKLQMFIRKNTAKLQLTSEKLVKNLNEEFIVIDSLDEFIDVANLYNIIAPSLIEDIIAMIPTDTD